MYRLGSRPLSSGFTLLFLALALALIGGASASAATPLPASSLGVNFSPSPPNLSAAAAAGAGVARTQVIEGSNTDVVVQLTAAAHLRLYPMLGIPVSHGPTADAKEMAQFVTSFAQRYGSGGSFWTQNPQLPYLPVQSYEIGNEPDITPSDPADQTSLHYADPNAFALVYQVARTALHAVDPRAKAVVGGVLDSGDPTLRDAERYLRAIGSADAIGYHPYLYDLSAMQQDTLLLRQWLNAHRKATVPLDINEFGAFLDPSGTLPGISAWGRAVAKFTQWALCTPSLRVENVQPEWWGATPGADADAWFGMYSSELTPTPLGSAYLGAVKQLTTTGCPAPAVRRPPKRSIGSAARTVAPHAKAVKAPVRDSSAKGRRRRRPLHKG